MADVLSMEQALAVQKRMSAIQCAQSFRQLLYNRTSDFSAVASVATETSLLSGASQPVLWKSLLDFTQVNRQFSLYGKGVFSTTGTPTLTFTIRIGSTAAAITGTALGVSAAITTINNSTNAMFEFRLDFMITTTIGIGAGNTTLSAAGWIKSPIGFASPFEYQLIPSQGALATWTATCDCSVDNFIQVAVTPSASSASNTTTLKHLALEAVN